MERRDRACQASFSGLIAANVRNGNVQIDAAMSDSQAGISLYSFAPVSATTAWAWPLFGVAVRNLLATLTLIF